MQMIFCGYIKQLLMMAVVVVVALPSPHSCVVAQGNSYLGLWGRVVESNATAGGGGGVGGRPGSGDKRDGNFVDRFHQASEEMRSRLIQRLAAGGATITMKAGPNATITSGPPSVSTGPNSSNSNSNRESGENIADSAATTTSNAVFDALDARQLATLAVANSLALGALHHHHHGPASPPREDLASSTASSSPSSLNAQPGVTRLGVALPDSIASHHFDPAWCLRLQNFGDAEGYRSIYFGPLHTTQGKIPCGPTAPGIVGAQLSWGARETKDGLGSSFSTPTSGWVVFTLDCTVNYKGGVEPLISIHKSMECRLSVVSSSSSSNTNTTTTTSTVAIPATVSEGRGMTLSTAESLPVFGHLGHSLNAIKLRVCNIPPTLVQVPSVLRNASTTITLFSPKLNGRPLPIPDGGHLIARQNAAGTGKECVSAFLRVPSRSLADDFVLTGVVALDASNNGQGGWGVGEMASVEVQVGAIKLFSASSGVQGGEIP